MTHDVHLHMINMQMISTCMYTSSRVYLKLTEWNQNFYQQYNSGSSRKPMIKDYNITLKALLGGYTVQEENNTHHQ